MKKEMIIFLLLLNLFSIVSAASGVSPASFEINFEPSFTKDYTFSYFFEGNPDVDFYLSGDLKDYAKIIEKRKALDRIFVTVRLSLPEKINKPGLNILRIGGSEQVAKEEGVGTAYDVGAMIKVRVPYPGKYAELELSVPNFNFGEKLKYSLNVHSRGHESIFASPRFEIENAEGVVDLFSINGKEIKSGESDLFEGDYSSDKLFPGNYNLTAYVDYGGTSISKITKEFRVGELRVDITNYTKTLESNKVNRVKIYIESFWNDPISSVYAEITFPKYPQEKVQTRSLTLRPWQKTYLTAFIDTVGVEDNQLDAIINVSYAGKTTLKKVTFEIKKPINWLLIGIITGSIIIFIIIIVLIIIIIKLLNKNKINQKRK